MRTRFRIAIIVAAGILAISYALLHSSQGSEAGAYIALPTVITPAVRILQQYVRIDTSNPPGDESAGARFLSYQLRQAGISAEVIESAPGRGNVYARIPGRRQGEGLLLLHHIDVVRADPKRWEHPPFSGDISMDRLHGRGTLDMKGIGIAHLLAFIELARTKKVPERDLVFLATADEESGGTQGIAWLLEHRPDIFEGISGAVSEGGITEMIADKVQYFGVEVGSKQFVKIKLSSPSKSDLQKLRIRLEPRFRPKEPDRLIPVVRQYFEQVSHHRTTNKEVFRDPDAAIARGEFWKLHSNYRTLTQNNLSASGIRQDGKDFLMDVTLQLLPDENGPLAVKNFAAAAGNARLEVTWMTGSAELSRLNTELFHRIQTAVRQSYKGVDVGPYIFAYGSTDLRYLRRKGIPAYGFFPFPVDYFQTETIHRDNEFIRLDRFREGVNLLSRLTLDYCFAR